MSTRSDAIRLAIPKGRMYDGVARLMHDAGAPIKATARDYRPAAGALGYEVKILKPRAVIEMLAAGARDVGFAGADWAAESGASLVELLDTGLDPVQLVAAAPASLLIDGGLPARPLIVATEYVTLTERWIRDAGVDAMIRRSYGATEVLPPEDADLIVDNTATGATLRANGLCIVDRVLASSTRLYASPDAMRDDIRRRDIEAFAMLLESVLEARSRVMLEVNIDADRLEALIERLPCMREPTVARLHGDAGFAVKAAVPRRELASVIPAVKACGGADIVVTSPEQIVL